MLAVGFDVKIFNIERAAVNERICCPVNFVFIPEHTDCNRAACRRIADKRAVICVVARINESIGIGRGYVGVFNFGISRAADFVNVDSAADAHARTIVGSANADRCQIGAD